jgi:hypothetical protein
MAAAFVAFNRVLPTSTEDGLVEYIKDSSVLSQVISQHKSITNFLKLHNPDPEGVKAANDRRGIEAQWRSHII